MVVPPSLVSAAGSSSGSHLSIAMKQDTTTIGESNGDFAAARLFVLLYRQARSTCKALLKALLTINKPLHDVAVHR